MDCSPPGFSVIGVFQAKHWSGLLFTPPGQLLTSRIKPASLMSPTLSRQIPYQLCHLGNPLFERNKQTNKQKKNASLFCPFLTSFLITTKLLKWSRKPNLAPSLVEGKTAGGKLHEFHYLIHRGLCVMYQNFEFQEQRHFLILLNLLWNCSAESHFFPSFFFRLHFFFF